MSRKPDRLFAMPEFHHLPASTLDPVRKTPVRLGSPVEFGSCRRYQKPLPPGWVLLSVRVQPEFYAWVHRLARFYGVLPGAIVERGLRGVVRQAKRLGTDEDFAGLPSLRKTRKR